MENMQVIEGHGLVRVKVPEGVTAHILDAAAAEMSRAGTAPAEPVLEPHSGQYRTYVLVNTDADGLVRQQTYWN